jgi:hypothetical protein
LNSPRSGRLIIAQHFSAGNRIALENKSVKRTTEFILSRASASAVRFTDWGFVFGRDPTDESVGYYQSSAARTLVGQWRIFSFIN